MSLLFCSWAWLVLTLKVMIPVIVAQESTEIKGKTFRSDCVA